MNLKLQPLFPFSRKIIPMTKPTFNDFVYSHSFLKYSKWYFMSTLKNLQKRSHQPNPNSAVLEKIIRLKIHFKVIKTLANMF